MSSSLNGSNLQQARPKRRYQEIWEVVIRRALAGDPRPVGIEVKGLKDVWFRRIRKAFWKEKDLDVVNRDAWRAKVWRGSAPGDENKIFFSATPKDWKDRI